MTGATPTNENDPTKHLHSHDKINYETNVDNVNVIKKLAEKLSVSGSYSVDYISESIMAYDKICEHDSAYLCEHRLQFIVDFVTNHFFSFNEMETNIKAFHLDSVEGNYNKELLNFANRWIENNFSYKKKI
jgi:hypothetical protein